MLLLFACKKDGNIVYSQLPASNNLFISISGTGNLNRTQQVSMLSTSTASTSVGLNLTIPATTDITAVIGVDTSKLSSYNAAYNTQFYLLPANCYTLQEPTNGLTIKAGRLFSTDSVKIGVKNLAGLRATNYLLPVTITKVSGNTSVVLSDSVKTVYINVTLTDVKQPTISLTTANGTTAALIYSVGATGPATTTPITVQISPASPYNITVTANTDTSLISKYGIGYTAFPNGSYTISPLSTVLNAGQLTATLNVSIPDLSKFDGSKDYLLPVTISKVTGDSYALTGNKTVYVKLNFNNLNNANNTSAVGKTLLSRQTWTVTASSAFDGTLFGGTVYPASNAIDGLVTTDWIGSGTSSITVDLGASQNIRTIAYNKAYSNILAAYGLDTYPEQVNIYTSSDGTNWVSQGTYTPIPDQGSPTLDPGVNYVNFFNAIPARYIKLQVPSYRGFSEINVYQ